ncbi:hypothetical protein G8C60_16210, partial [Cellulosimicrobium cellulans]|nr:hypothetical protein [Cellulosimicrobium cellulans]
MTHDLPAWSVRESALDVDDPATAASLLSLANGYVGVRGTLDEADPDDDPSTLVASVHEEFEQTYAERAYAYPEVEERLVPVVDAWRLGWSVDGEPVDVRTADPAGPDGTVEAHERVLDLRRGVLRRELRWTAPSGGTVTLHNERLVPLWRREVVASRWRVLAHDGVTVTLRPVPGCAHGGQDPGREAPGLV